MPIKPRSMAAAMNAAPEQRHAVKVSTVERTMLDLMRTSEPLPPHISESIVCLMDFVMTGKPKPETASELWQRLQPDSKLVGIPATEIGDAPRPSFQVGDVVQLQSGGHLMCVIGVGPACDGSGETVTVMWSADNDHRAGLAGPLLPSRNIPPDCLKVVDPDIPF